MAFDDALFQLGMDLTRSSTAQKEDPIETAHIAHEDTDDLFTKRDCVRFAGTHLGIDLYGAKRLADTKVIERTLKRCIETAGAKLLHIHLHQVTPQGGVSAVAVHDKGHVNMQTWPDRGFLAIDVLFMERSGKLREQLVKLVDEAFEPRELVTKVTKRAEDSSRPALRLAPVETPVQSQVEHKPRAVRPRVARAA